MKLFANILHPMMRKDTAVTILMKIARLGKLITNVAVLINPINIKNAGIIPWRKINPINVGTAIILVILQVNFAAGGRLGVPHKKVNKVSAKNVTMIELSKKITKTL